MESIIIVMIGLILSVLSKSVKDKKEIEKERQKRKEQINEGYQPFESYDESTTTKPSTRPSPQRNQKSLRDMFMEELDKVGDEDGNIGDIFKRTLGGEQKKEIQLEKMEASDDSYENMNEEEQKKYRDREYMGDSDYIENTYTTYEDYSGESKIEGGKSIKGSEIIAGESQVKSGVENKLKGKIHDNRQYNPFTKSLNKKDIIRGIIFSEVLGKPKSFKNEKRSM